VSAAPRLRILLVDDHPLVLAGIRTVLTRAAEFEVVGTATDGLQVLPLVEQTKPDVVLLDMRMPGLDWLACLTRIRVQYPDVVVVILSASTAAVSREAALAAGAAGYIHKDIDLNGLAAAVSRAIARARSGQSRARSGGALLDGLTEREILVLEQVSNGRGNREIAEALYISQIGRAHV